MSKAFVFPGQGSQSVGMLAELAEHYSIVRETFNEASELLNYDLWQLTQTGPNEKLNQTEYTQPAMLVAGVSVWRVYQQQGGLVPQCVAGHSLGEYTALVCAKALEFSAAVKLVAKRGQLMQEAVPAGQGAMAAVMGLSDNEVNAICLQASRDHEVVTPANFNTIGQIVIAGTTAAVKRALVLATEKGAMLATMLAVSVPAHCSLMKPAAQLFAEVIEGVDIKSPQIAVINNVDVAIEHDPLAIKAALVRQIYSPVRWVEIIQAFAARGVQKIVECGPGKVLAKLNKRVDKELDCTSIHDSITLSQELGK